jgi:hypothetical protein
MAPFQYQYLPQETYRSPYTTTLASLMGAPDRAQAGAAMASGQAWAGAAQQVGSQVATGLHDLMRYQEAAPQREMTQIQLRQARETQADDAATRFAFQDAKGDPIKAVETLEQGGNYGPAMKIRSQLNEQRLKGLDEVKKTLEITDDRLKTASQLLQGVSGAPDPAAAYAAVLPKVRAVIGQDLAGHLPDAYNPDVVKQAMSWGMKASEVVALRRQATLDANSAIRNALTKTELVDKLTHASATWAQTIDTPEEWAQMLEQVKHLGGDSAPDVLAKFAPDYSPDAVAAATKLLGQVPTYREADVLATVDGKTRLVRAGFDPKRNQYFLPGTDVALQNVRPLPAKEGAALNSTELTKALIANPEIYNDLTDSVKSELWQSGTLRQAGFTPPARRDSGSSRAVAERWKTTQLHKIDENVALGIYGQGTDAQTAAAAAREEIEASYRAQIGGAEKPAPATPGGPPVAAKTPPKAKAAAVPDAVTQVLSKQKPGKYTLSDGSKWIVDKAGAITPGS